MGDRDDTMRDSIRSGQTPAPPPFDVTFEVPLPPKGKERARTVVHGGKARTYTPSGTTEWQARLAMMARESMPTEALEGPIRVDLVCIVHRPNRLRRKCDPAGLGLWACSKPDGDNIAKAVLDSLGAKHGAGFWRDDAQVSDLRVVKVHVEKDGRPRMIIRIRRPARDPRGEIYAMTGKVPSA